MKRYCIITIEREYASGGSLVGQACGAGLGHPGVRPGDSGNRCREGGTTPEYIEHLEETDTNSLLYSLVAMAKTVQGQLPQISKTDQLNLLEARIIQRLAQEGPCVIVGRCAGWVLREQPHVLNVFIHADRQERLRRAGGGVRHPPGPGGLCCCTGLTTGAPTSTTPTQGAPGGSGRATHMVLDSGLLGVELCSQLLVAAAQSEG